MFLISAQDKTGTGQYSQAAYWSDVSYIHLDCSGNSASATLLTSPDGVTRWMAVTSWALGVNSTATAQIQSYFPFVRGQVDWVSAGTDKGTVTMVWQGRLQGA